MLDGELGQMVTPNERRLPLVGVPFGADNGCFSKNYVGDEKWFTWLTLLSRLFIAGPDGELLRRAGDGTCIARIQPSAADFLRVRDYCLFATAPDVVGDAAATLARSLPWLPKIRSLGLPAALVAQDGLENLNVPWDEFDALFIGGTTEFKLSDHAKRLAAEAKQRGKYVHMGRVNSGRRWTLARDEFGCDSCDGTFLAFGPDTNLARMRKWVAA